MGSAMPLVTPISQRESEGAQPCSLELHVGRLRINSFAFNSVIPSQMHINDTKALKKRV